MTAAKFVFLRISHKFELSTEPSADIAKYTGALKRKEPLLTLLISAIALLATVTKSTIRMFEPRSSSRWRDWFTKRKKRRNLYLLLSYVQRLIALPCQSRTATRRSPRLYMQSMPPAVFLSEYHAGCKIITYPRASTVARPLTLTKILREFLNVKNQRG